MRVVLTLAAGAVLMGLGSCATMSEDQCLAGDWYGQGRSDGAAGYGPGRLSDHTEACTRHGVTPDANAYYEGHEVGVRQYCVPGRAFRIAASGGGYSNGFCPADLEQDFLYAYSDGRLVWDAIQRANAVRARVDEFTARAREYEEDIRDEEYRLANEEGLTEEDRRTIRERIRRLRRDRDTANDQANALSYDVTDADREVSRLRSRFTPVYGNW
ncbi:MAG: hypothetical protein ACI8U3_003056 [Brevundimonas sp.]|jgi:hypothetical protein|uniref:DUF2799 domain-containing protein n=1 Tax=Brevundimonas sp. TaxID=1871086 RepID=UPI0039E51643